jgi:hypothetical protein
MLEYGQRLMSWAESGEEYCIDDDVIETWFAILWRLLPLCLPLIPVLMVQWKYYNWPQAISMLFIFISMMCFIDITWSQRIYILTTTLACMMSSGPYGLMPEVIGGLFSILFFVCVSFMSDVFFQFGAAILIFMVYIAWLVHTFTTRRPGATAGMIIMITILMVMAEQVHLLRREYRLNSFNMDAVQMVINSICPNGKYWFFTRNAINIASAAAHNVVRLLPGSDKYILVFFFVFSVSQLLLAIAFRTLFGMFTILSMRYHFNASNAYKGFFIYMTDVFGGFSIVLNVVGGVQKYDSRRFAYALVNIFLLSFEFYYGIDILALRMIFWFGDKFIFNTGLCALPRYLQVDMRTADFPQDGAQPWLKLEEILKLAQHVVVVRCQSQTNGMSRGLGFLVKNGNKVCLLSVRHVMNGLKSLSFRDQTVTGPSPTFYSTELDDPVAKIVVSKECDGADIELLDFNEVSSVDSMFFIKMDENDEALITYITRPWQFSDSGHLRACVDLDRGNSGGPVFAVLSDGNIRYVGCVSAGDVSASSGNYISCVTARSDSQSIGCDNQVSSSLVMSNPEDRERKEVKRKNKECVEILNRSAQSFHDLAKSYWYIDESRNDDEARIIHEDDDIFNFIDAMYADDGVKHDSNSKPGKKQRWTGLSKDELDSKIGKALRKMFIDATNVFNDESAAIFMRDVRFGVNARVKIVDEKIIYKPLIFKKRKMKRFEYEIDDGSNS